MTTLLKALVVLDDRFALLPFLLKALWLLGAKLAHKSPAVAAAPRPAQLQAILANPDLCAHEAFAFTRPAEGASPGASGHSPRWAGRRLSGGLLEEAPEFGEREAPAIPCDPWEIPPAARCPNIAMEVRS